jgi:hypothetical protein
VETLFLTYIKQLLYRIDRGFLEIGGGISFTTAVVVSSATRGMSPSPRPLLLKQGNT